MTDSTAVQDDAVQDDAARASHPGTEHTEHYDLIIIGTGSGNSIPEELDDRRIALVEKGIFGGTCINVGCIPTKMYVYTADVAAELAEAGRYNLSPVNPGTGEPEEPPLWRVDWPALQERVFGRRIDPISRGGEEYRRGSRTPNITYYPGVARFTGERTLRIDTGGQTVTVTADQVVLATGTRTRVPAVIAESGVRYRTNADVMRMEKLPRTMVILGGGIIAVEFAHVFSALGVEVFVVNRSDTLLRRFDATVRSRFTAAAGSQWTNLLGRTVTSAREEGGLVTVTLDDGREIDCDELLLAQGRVPNSDLLDCAAGGVDLDAAGKIVVDRFGRTSAPGVWALGDAANDFELKHVANQEARAVFHNVACSDEQEMVPFKLDNVPGGVFSRPQIGYVGMTEDEAREWARDNGRTLTVKVQEYSDVAYGWAMEDSTGFCKLIADAGSRRLLGAHIMGPQAATLIQLLVTAIEFDLDLVEFARKQYWPHPGLSELVENALLGLEFE
ncbi:mycothione reductase [Corynebacterium neomassiliense]|uniref:mycothione reductase n=1 Tax=Corynebacterium neomassiliense TaxID=2079482 RepID=UPI0010304CA4|nr:mycothione reductase [Corynebacterium neomassiliense]